MTPDIELQLQVVIKSLKDNVVPAVDVGNQLAQEQMHLSIATLEIVLGHLPHVHDYLRRDLGANLQLAAKLHELIGDEMARRDLESAIDMAGQALADAGRGFTRLQHDARVLRDVVSAVVRDNGNHPDVARIEKLVLEAADITLNLGRAWHKPHGFEPRPEEVAGLEELLNR